MFKQIRVKIGQHNLLKEQLHLGRNLHLKNLDQAKKIGILYTLDDIPDYNKISDFVSKIQHKQKDIKEHIEGVFTRNNFKKVLPNESIVYVWDTARVPYGTRSEETITKFALEIARALLDKDVKALGFVKNKNLITRFLPKLSFDFFSIRDLSWFYKPIHTKLKDFIEKEFDLLIDLSTYESFPLKYIAGLSHSLCKVGRFSEENSNYYDLMIDIKPSATLDDYIGQVRHYLTIINVDEEKN